MSTKPKSIVHSVVRWERKLSKAVSFRKGNTKTKKQDSSTAAKPTSSSNETSLRGLSHLSGNTSRTADEGGSFGSVIIELPEGKDGWSALSFTQAPPDGQRISYSTEDDPSSTPIIRDYPTHVGVVQ